MIVAKLDRFDMHNTPGSDGSSFTIWFAGCTHMCDGCQNKVLWDKNHGVYFDPMTLAIVVTSELEHSGLHKVVLLGGEPLQQDLEELSFLCSYLHAKGNEIWLYTGYDFDEVPKDMLDVLDYIKCGKYDKSKLTDEGSFPISTNQHLYHKDSDAWIRIK